MYYDRTATPALIGELGPKGAFSYLVHIARTQHLADLQLRGYPRKKPCWATLYVGLTSVIDVREKGGQFWFKHKPHTSWDAAWEQPRPAAAWHELAQSIHAYIDEAIRGVPERFTNEGAVQSMLCTRASALFSVIDREAVVGFANTAERVSTYQRLQQPLHDACIADPAQKWFVPKWFGGELDLLAVDPQGRLLVVEIKPASSTSGIAWAPLQATCYAELFRAWSDEVGDASRVSLESMLRQRVTLNLTKDPLRSLQYPLDIVPVVAIGGDQNQSGMARLRQVQDALLRGGVGWPNLEVWHVEESVAQVSLRPSSG